MLRPRIKVGLVTAWGECGMGHLAKNWVYTFDKHEDKIEYQIFSRALPWLTPYRWGGRKVVNGPESMDINTPTFWKWIDDFQPDVILFQDQNIYSKTQMQEESHLLKGLGIKLINYPDWIRRGDLKKYKGLYDVTLSHTKRNYNWFVQSDLESPTLIPWGVIVDHFSFVQRKTTDRIRFYINLGTGTKRKGYTSLPKALNKMQGGPMQRIISPRKHDYEFIASSIEGSENRVAKSFTKYFNKNSNCRIVYKTADNSKGGLFNLGDIYVYPTRREGVGLTITEAMCTGMPVITTNYPTMNEWITDNEDGRLVNVRKIKNSSMPTDKVMIDEEHLAQIMIDYIDNPDKVMEHSKQARETIITQFNWDDRDKEILKVVHP